MSPTSPQALTLHRAVSPSTCAHGVAAQTGRPAMWTKSYQRKMARLYVYTTLPLHKILDVVHHNSPMGVPGTDSANKNLNTLLDKEPRWLHPRSHADMARRVAQLALSSSRMSPRSSQAAECRASSDPPAANFPPVQYRPELSVSPTLLAVPPSTMASWSAPASPVSPSSGPAEWLPTQQRLPNPDEDQDRLIFAPFLRRATITSTSTNTSASSLRDVLPEYSTAFRGVVKGLIRRFTGPLPRRIAMSPISEANSAIVDWLDDDEAPRQYNDRPFPLPGDFLNIDSYAQCLQSPDHGYRDHDYRRCLCSAAEEFLQTPTASSPWVTPAGLTQCGSRILLGQISQRDCSDVDSFGNTIMHFLAARGDATLLLKMISVVQPQVLHKANEAGQTFLHVLKEDTITQTEVVRLILQKLTQADVDIYAQDHYGRNVFHMMRANDVDQLTLNRILEPYDAKHWNIRDAFGEKPRPLPLLMTSNPSTDSASLGDPLQPNEAIVIAHTQLINLVNRAIGQDAMLEDSQGRNGLHCLAAANLSMSATSPTLNISQPTTIPSPTSDTTNNTAISTKNKRRTSGGKKKSDSTNTRMELRYSLLNHLLNNGVPSNGYDNHGNTPLMAFAAQLPEDGNYKLGPNILEMLVKRGASVHARNRAGETALHVAVRCGRKLAVRTLVRAGANVHARDAMGRSVLDVADAKIMAVRDDCPKVYAKLEACRAWLSGQGGKAVQKPTVMAEWGRSDL